MDPNHRLTEYRIICSSERDDVDRLVRHLLSFDAISNHDDLMKGLEWACIHGNVKIVKYLLEHHKSLSLTIGYGRILFLLMCDRGDVDTLSWLKDRFDFQSPLFMRESLRTAAVANQVHVLTWLLNHYTKTDDDLNNALLYACGGDALDSIRWLVKHIGISDTLTIEDGMREACKYGSVRVVRFLLDEFHMSCSGACFACACTHGQFEVAKMLLDQFPTLLETPHTKILGYLDYVACRGDVSMMKWLVEKFPDAILGDDGNLLYRACSRNYRHGSRGYLDMVRYLVNHLHYDHSTVCKILKGDECSMNLVSMRGECIEWLEQQYGCNFQ